VLAEEPQSDLESIELAGLRKEATSWKPQTALEQRQRSIIDHLIVKLGLEEEIMEKEEEWMRMIRVVGDLGMASDIQMEKLELEETRSELLAKEQSVADALRHTDNFRGEVGELERRVSARVVEATAAEKELERLEETRRDLIRKCAEADVKVDKAEAKTELLEAELQGLTALLTASLRDVQGVKARITATEQQVVPVTAQLDEVQQKLASLEAELFHSTNTIETLRSQRDAAITLTTVSRAAAASAEREKIVLAAELQIVRTDASAALELKDFHEADALSLPKQIASTRAELELTLAETARLRGEAGPGAHEVARLMLELDLAKDEQIPLRRRSLELADRQSTISASLKSAERQARELKQAIELSTERTRQARDSKQLVEASLPDLQARRDALAVARKAANFDAATTASLLLVRTEELRACILEEKESRKGDPDSGAQLQRAAKEVESLLRSMDKEQQKAQAAFGVGERRDVLQAQLDKLLQANADKMQALAQAVSASCRATEQLRGDVSSAFESMSRLEEQTKTRYVSSIAAKQTLQLDIGALQASCEQQVKRISDADRSTRTLESDVEAIRRKLLALQNERDVDDDKRPPKSKGDKIPGGDELSNLLGSLFSR